MISPKEFKQLWLEEWSPLHAYGEEAVRNLPFSDSTKEFLVASGLPESCAPFLSFNRTLPNQSIKTIKEEYNLEHDDFINYYVIGDGDNVSICIDTNREDQIFEIDFHYVYDIDAREDTDYHEDYRPIIFMNTSIRHLAHCVLVYRHFIDEIKIGSKW